MDGQGEDTAPKGVLNVVGRGLHRRRPPEEWAEIRALYRAGATAKALAARFGGTERTIYTHLNRHDCLRKDQGVVESAWTPEEASAEARRISGCEADAPCRALEAGASLGEAARAAAVSAIAMLREAQPTRAYTYARLAGQLERLARGGAATEGDDPDGTARGRRAALDFLRGETGRIGSPSPEGEGGDAERRRVGAAE